MCPELATANFSAVFNAGAHPFRIPKPEAQ